MHHGHHSSQGQPLTHFAYKPWGTVMAVGHDHGLGAQSSPGMRVVLLPLTRILLPTPPHTSSPPSTLTPDPHQFLSLAPALPSPSSPLPPPCPQANILVALLQPSPETYEIFDDIILLNEGKIASHTAVAPT